MTFLTAHRQTHYLFKVLLKAPLLEAMFRGDYYSPSSSAPLLSLPPPNRGAASALTSSDLTTKGPAHFLAHHSELSGPQTSLCPDGNRRLLSIHHLTLSAETRLSPKCLTLRGFCAAPLLLQRPSPAPGPPSILVGSRAAGGLCFICSVGHRSGGHRTEEWSTARINPAPDF